LRRVEKPTRVWPDTHTSGPTHRPPAGASFSFASFENEISVRVRVRACVCARARARSCVCVCVCVRAYIPPLNSLLALARTSRRTPKDNTVTSHTRLMLFLCRRRGRWRRRCWYNDVTLSAPYAYIHTPTQTASYAASRSFLA